MSDQGSLFDIGPTDPSPPGRRNRKPEPEPRTGPDTPGAAEYELFSTLRLRVFMRRFMTEAELTASNLHYASALMVWRPVQSRNYTVRRN